MWHTAVRGTYATVYYRNTIIKNTFDFCDTLLYQEQMQQYTAQIQLWNLKFIVRCIWFLWCTAVSITDTTMHWSNLIMKFEDIEENEYYEDENEQ